MATQPQPTTETTMTTQTQTTKYQVVSHEQHGSTVWSTHTTLALAEAAARRYARRNRVPGQAVNHLGFTIRTA